MNPQFSELVHPVITYALDLKERLDNGDEPDLEAEQRQLIDRLRSDGEVRRLDRLHGRRRDLPRRPLRPDLLDRRAVHRLLAPGRTSGRSGSSRSTLYGSRDRAWKFWDQAEIALRRPNTPRLSTPPGPDALETFFLCIVLGFRGKYLENPAQGEGVRRGDAAPGHPDGDLVGAARARSEDQCRAAPGPHGRWDGRSGSTAASSLVLVLVLLIVLSVLGYLGS